ncbi:MAG: SIS domain-containing protein [Gammaproteobacteria bacterium]|nr:SIS domain-containing protein [Gammaproteobacteria bacterium]
MVIGVSQSGKSPDICEMMKSARAAGAVTVAIVNHVESPLAKLAEFVVPMWAGEEIAVAATKSYIASLSAALQFWSIYSGDAALSAALSALPETLKKASECNWTSLGAGLKNAVNTLVLGRGFGFPVAQEAALKFKETSSIHGEAFSSAEVMHGPMGLVRNQLPLLMVTQNDATLAGNIALAEKLQQIGGKPFVALPKGLNVPGVEKLKNVLPLPKSLHPLCDPLMAIQAFYPMAADLAVSRGFNPDSPQNLKKVTETR